jgi:hypothetical protein
MYLPFLPNKSCSLELPPSFTANFIILIMFSYNFFFSLGFKVDIYKNSMKLEIKRKELEKQKKMTMSFLKRK